ncbi:hypothetical protein QCA50_007515 [Cerrena zonata]|uniref:Uncharacterized protein n=1 Tax=Cerrena zonata TaxID=2478898 RepID=A0AAW0G7Z7_9APHY
MSTTPKGNEHCVVLLDLVQQISKSTQNTTQIDRPIHVNVVPYTGYNVERRFRRREAAQPWRDMQGKQTRGDGYEGTFQCNWMVLWRTNFCRPARHLAIQMLGQQFVGRVHSVKRSKGRSTYHYASGLPSFLSLGETATSESSKQSRFSDVAIHADIPSAELRVVA